MATEGASQGRQVAGGYKPNLLRLEDRGYQPQLPRPLDPQNLTPPKGDTAVQPPQAPALAPPLPQPKQ